MGRNIFSRKVMKAAEKAMGGIGENFMRRQCERLNMDLDDLDREDLPQLATEVKANSVLIVGKARAQALHAELMKIFEE